MNQHGHDDLIANYLVKNKIPLTRENYLGIAYPDGLPAEWGPDDEADLPESIRETTDVR